MDISKYEKEEVNETLGMLIELILIQSTYSVDIRDVSYQSSSDNAYQCLEDTLKDLLCRCWGDNCGVYFEYIMPYEEYEDADEILLIAREQDLEGVFLFIDLPIDLPQKNLTEKLIKDSMIQCKPLLAEVDKTHTRSFYSLVWFWDDMSCIIPIIDAVMWLKANRGIGVDKIE